MWMFNVKYNKLQKSSSTVSIKYMTLHKKCSLCISHSLLIFLYCLSGDILSIQFLSNNFFFSFIVFIFCFNITKSFPSQYNINIQLGFVLVKPKYNKQKHK
jgi:hypothetical protein